MLNLTTALGRNGLQDWLLQRVTAVILALYSLFLLTFWFINGHKDTIAWQNLFSLGTMQFATIVALIAVMIHAWIGLWIVCTDYIKHANVRIVTLIFIYCWLLFDLIWCLQIMGGY